MAYGSSGGGAAVPRSVYEAPKRRKRRDKLTSRTPLKPTVGNLTKGGGLVRLPRNQRFANKGTSPTTEPVGPNEPPSKPYKAAKRRTKQKYGGR